MLYISRETARINNLPKRLNMGRQNPCLASSHGAIQPVSHLRTTSCQPSLPSAGLRCPVCLHLQPSSQCFSSHMCCGLAAFPIMHLSQGPKGNENGNQQVQGVANFCVTPTPTPCPQQGLQTPSWCQGINSCLHRTVRIIFFLRKNKKLKVKRKTLYRRYLYDLVRAKYFSPRRLKNTNCKWLD